MKQRGSSGERLFSLTVIFSYFLFCFYYSLNFLSFLFFFSVFTFLNNTYMYCELIDNHFFSIFHNKFTYMYTHPLFFLCSTKT